MNWGIEHLPTPGLQTVVDETTADDTSVEPQPVVVPASALETCGAKSHVAARMAARFDLWRATRSRDHLLESKRLLDQLVDHAPEAHRKSMLENVPLHREIVAAAAEYGDDDHRGSP